MFLAYLDKIIQEDKIRAFGSEYRFYSIILEQFRANQFYDCMKIVIDKLNNLVQPSSIYGEIQGFQNFLEDNLNKGFENIGIWGGGYYGKLLLYRLSLRGVSVKVFIDNSFQMQGTEIDGIPCISPTEAAARDIAVIISLRETQAVEKQMEKLKMKRYLKGISVERFLNKTGIIKKYIMKKS